MNNLNEYASDLTSGDGTNGILAEIFKRLEIKKGTCVEFGANDGLWNSNTYPFWKDGRWIALLIEPDTHIFNKLNKNVGSLNNVFAINSYVSPYPKGDPRAEPPRGHYPLDTILQNFNNNVNSPIRFEKDFDLLSIDVDGNDYHIWKNLKDYNPKCVVIEYNQTIPPSIEFIDDIQEYLGIGASIKSLEKLGEEKGYSLVSSTGSNLIFVDNTHIKKLGPITTRIEDLYDIGNLCCLVSTQKQDRVYLTKERPANYYMTFEKASRWLGRIYPNDQKELKLYKELYPVQVNYEFSDHDSVRIFDGCLVFEYKEKGLGEAIQFSARLKDVKNLLLTTHHGEFKSK